MPTMFDLLGGSAAGETPQVKEQPGMFSGMLSGVQDAVGGANQKLQSDPNLQRALLIAGLNMARPGMSIGQAGLAGVSAYELGKQAEVTKQQREAEAQRKMDEAQRADEMHRENVLGKQFDRNDQATRTGYEGRKVAIDEENSKSSRNLQTAQAAEVGERTKYIGRKADADIRQSNASATSSYASADNARANAENMRQKTKTDKVSDFQAKVEAFSNLPEFASETDPVRRKALATQKVIQTERGYATGMKLEQADNSAIAMADYFDSLDPQDQRILMATDANVLKQVAMGRRLRKEANGQVQQAAPQPLVAPAPNVIPQKSTEPPRRVIRLQDINETRSDRMSGGTIERK